MKRAKITDREAAKRHGCHPSTILRKRRRRGISRARYPTEPKDIDWDAIVHDRAYVGLLQWQLAEVLRCSQQVVSSQLRKRGVKMGRDRR